MDTAAPSTVVGTSNASGKSSSTEVTRDISPALRSDSLPPSAATNNNPKRLLPKASPLRPFGGSGRSLVNRKIPRHPNLSTRTTAKRSLSVDARIKTEPQTTTDPVELEQTLFEQRLCEDPQGVGVRKINKFGKSTLRYVKCEIPAKSSSRSVGNYHRHNHKAEEVRSLTWGRKKEVQVPLTSFTHVRKGKTTERTNKNACPSSKLLSLISTDSHHPVLDIEAPTSMDRDKFARAFARFLQVPLVEERTNTTESAETPLLLHVEEKKDDSQFESSPPQPPPKNKSPTTQQSMQSSTNRESTTGRDDSAVSFSNNTPVRSAAATDDNNTGSLKERAIVSLVPNGGANEDEGGSHLSSLTGQGFDQELVEELHTALTELRAELEESRAEAARAVKVAEQAIQSAEQSDSVEWQNTVTHKAAEAAAIAQKRSVVALQKQRVAEDRLDGERRAASFWRKQAEVAEEEAGALQTRAAAAEVQRAAAEQQLEYERRMAAEQIARLKGRFGASNLTQSRGLEEAMQKNRELEMELEEAQRTMENRSKDEPVSSPRNLKIPLFGRMRKASLTDSDAESLLARDIATSCSNDASERHPNTQVSSGSVPTELYLQLQEEALHLRHEFELLKKSTADHLEKLPGSADRWASQISQVMLSSQTEVTRLQEKLALESAARRKILHEVQDLRGSIRVYCRPRPNGPNGRLTLPSQETIMLKQSDDMEMGTSFEFDRVFDPQTKQQEVFAEIEEVCLGVLDGYRICLMALGPEGCGKTSTMIGKPESNHGIKFLTLKQLFSIAKQRDDRYKDKFSLSIVEVFNERLIDLVSATPTGGERGQQVNAQLRSNRKKKTPSVATDDDTTNKQSRLEIRTDVNGETIVQGATTLDVDSFEDVELIWKECVDTRARKAEELGMKLSEYEASCHLIITVKVLSTNITTGVTTAGKIQFADLAGVVIENTDDSPSDWKFSNRSLETLRECVEARIQFERSVPYRTSTLTHLLRDNLEADTKMIVIACVSAEKVEQSLATLKFASRMRRVFIGRATRHTVTAP